MGAPGAGLVGETLENPGRSIPLSHSSGVPLKFISCDVLELMSSASAMPFWLQSLAKAPHDADGTAVSTESAMLAQPKAGELSEKVPSTRRALSLHEPLAHCP